MRLMVAITCLTIAACSPLGSGVAADVKPATGSSATTAPQTSQRVLPAAKSPAVLKVTQSCPSLRGTKFENPVLLIPLATVLVQAVAPAILKYFIEAGADYVGSGADELSASSTAADEADLYVLSTHNSAMSVALNSGCLIFARGQLSGTAAAAANDVYWNEGRLAELKAITGIVGRPEIYAEFKMAAEFIDGSLLVENGAKTPTSRVYTFISIKPVFIDYAVSGAQKNPNSEKQLIFDFRLEQHPLPGEQLANSLFLNATIDLGMRKIGSQYVVAELSNKSSPRFPIPQLHEVKIGGKIGANAKEISLVSSVPFRATVSLTETEPGGDIERAVAAAVKSNEDKIAKPVLDYIDQQLKKLATPTPASNRK